MADQASPKPSSSASLSTSRRKETMFRVVEVRPGKDASYTPYMSMDEINSLRMRCELCNLEFDCCSLFHHGVEQHGAYICLHCLTSFPKSSNLSAHLQTSHNINPEGFLDMKKFICKKGFQNYMICCDCGSTHDVEEVNIHQTIEEHTCGEARTCSFCKRKFANSLFLKHQESCPLRQQSREVPLVQPSKPQPKNTAGAKENSFSGPNLVGISHLRNRTRCCKKCGTYVSVKDSASHKLQCTGKSTGQANNFSTSPKSAIQLQIPGVPMYDEVPNVTPVVNKKPKNKKEIPVLNQTVNGNGTDLSNLTPTISGDEACEDFSLDGHSDVGPESVESNSSYETSSSEPGRDIEEEIAVLKSATDPLLTEEDPLKRLTLLVEELFIRIQALIGNGSDTFKGADNLILILRSSFQEENSDMLLKQMVKLSQWHCNYCRQAKYIRVDKRQLVIHLLSKHKWKVQICHPSRVNVLRMAHEMKDDVDFQAVKLVMKNCLQQLDVLEQTSEHSSNTSGGSESALSYMDSSTCEESLVAENSDTESKISTPENIIELRKSNDTSRDDFNLEMVHFISYTEFCHILLSKVYQDSQNVFWYFFDEEIHVDDLPCECLICGVQIESRTALFNHWKKIHKGVTMSCIMCHGRFLFAGALFSHLCLGTNDPIVPSITPGTNSEAKDSVMVNLKSPAVSAASTNSSAISSPSISLDGASVSSPKQDHPVGVGDTLLLRYQCGLCKDLVLPTFFNFMVHIRKDHNKCELCLESADSQKNLEHHIKKHKLNHFCWKCGVSYVAKPNFMTHMFWKHGTESVECSKCLKKKWPHCYHFCVPSMWFNCETCELYFTRAKSLIVHRRIHTREKLRKCPKANCNESFISKYLLQKHLETFHATTPVNQSMDVEHESDHRNDSPISNESPPVQVLNGSCEKDDLIESNAEAKEEVSSTKPLGENAHDEISVQPLEHESSTGILETSFSPSIEDSSTDKLSPSDLTKPDSEANSQSEVQEHLSPLKETVVSSSEPQITDPTSVPRQPDSTTEQIENSIDVPGASLTPTVSPSKKKKRTFKLSEIQGPNLSEDEDSDANSFNDPKELFEDSFPSDDTSKSLTQTPSIPDDAEDGNTGLSQTDILENGMVDMESTLEDYDDSKDAVENHIDVSDDSLSNCEKDFMSEYLSESKDIIDTFSETLKDDNSQDESFVANLLDQCEDVEKNLNLSAMEIDKRKNSDSPIPQASSPNSQPQVVDPVDSFNSQVTNKLTEDFSEMPGLDTKESNCTVGVENGVHRSSPPEVKKELVPVQEEKKENSDFKPLPKQSNIESVTRMLSSDFNPDPPLLTSLGDFSFNVPDIPTFEENSLPDHIIRENAMFSILMEHDYDYVKQKAEFKHDSYTGVPADSFIYSLYQDLSTPPSSSVKRKRCPSSSSSSSSSCSTCPTNCSCSGSRSGSRSRSRTRSRSRSRSRSRIRLRSRSRSSSSSSSSSSESEKEVVQVVKRGRGRPPLRGRPRHVAPLCKETGVPVKRGRGRPKGSLNKNRTPKPLGTPRGAKRGPKPGERKKNTKTDNSGDVQPLPFKTANEVELETDDSGSEEIFHNRQLREPIGAKTSTTDEIWTMSNESYLLKYLRGVRSVDELKSKFKEQEILRQALLRSMRAYSRRTAAKRAKKMTAKIPTVKPKEAIPPVVMNEKQGPLLAVSDTDESPVASLTFQQNTPPKAVLNVPVKKKAKTKIGKGRSVRSRIVPNSKPVQKSTFTFRSAASSSPSEKLYCICQSPHDNVSQMIGCDGLDCEYEWFHFECVGITIPPEGKWFCSDCRNKKRKKCSS